MQMDSDRPWYASAGDATSGPRVPGSDLLGTYGLSFDVVVRAAAAEVDELIAELEGSLNARERRLLHQLRLAAESLGTIRASASLMGTRFDPSRSSPCADR
jgi:hypothetical protein